MRLEVRYLGHVPGELTCAQLAESINVESTRQTVEGPLRMRQLLGMRETLLRKPLSLSKHKNVENDVLIINLRRNVAVFFVLCYLLFI